MYDSASIILSLSSRRCSALAMMSVCLYEIVFETVMYEEIDVSDGWKWYDIKSTITVCNCSTFIIARIKFAADFLIWYSLSGCIVIV